jgi:hypothetical protein
VSADADVVLHGYRELAAGSEVLARRIGARAGRDMQPVAEDVRRRVAGRVPRRSGRLAASVETEAVQGGVGVSYSGAVPYDGWIDFGGTRGRPYAASGRYLYPTALDAGPRLQDACERGATMEIGAMTWPTPTV